MKSINIKTSIMLKTKAIFKPVIFVLVTCLSFISTSFAQAEQLTAKENYRLAAESGNTISTTDLFNLLALIGVVLLVLIVALGSTIKNIASAKKVWRNVSPGKSGKATLIALLAFSTTNAFAGDNSPVFMEINTTAVYIMLTIDLILLGVFLYMLSVLRSIVYAIRGEKVVEAERAEKKAASANWYADIMKALTKQVELEEEDTVLMKDHEYDGIQELDNKLPPWWLYMFYFTIASGVVYLFLFITPDSGFKQVDEYNEEIRIAEEAEQKRLMLAALEKGEGAIDIDENTVQYVTDGSALSDGAAIFKNNCATCHGQAGEGGTGPNLTDEYWIHGGGIKNVFTTIKYGVPEKGMTKWDGFLSPDKMQSVASYILSLKGSNPANAKAPQGEIWVEEEISTEDKEQTENDSVEVINAE